MSKDEVTKTIFKLLGSSGVMYVYSLFMRILSAPLL